MDDGLTVAIERLAQSVDKASAKLDAVAEDVAALKMQQEMRERNIADFYAQKWQPLVTKVDHIERAVVDLEKDAARVRGGAWVMGAVWGVIAALPGVLALFGWGRQ